MRHHDSHAPVLIAQAADSIDGAVRISRIFFGNLAVIVDVAQGNQRLGNRLVGGIEKHCPTCSEEFGLALRRSVAARQTYCSHACAPHGPPIDKAYTAKMWQAVKLRRQGLVWREIADRIDVGDYCGLPSKIRAKARQQGWDITDILPGDGTRHCVLSPVECGARSLAGRALRGAA